MNRVGEIFSDQTRLSGHQEREADIDLFAALGLSALRYPVLWERAGDAGSWEWHDRRLARIRAAGMRPIVGLIHHGSGPRGVDLLHPEFAGGLAAHARRAAERYPWVRDWTPVNEPLTTARFSALYGLWHPHLRDEGAFWRALLNQVDAVRLAMREIRKVRPDARLVQTEDVGKTFSTALLEYQAEHDNHRRWATWDLLSGRLDETHPLWERLVRFGLDDRARTIAADPCPADVIGINHYLTSDRFLDHRCGRYPGVAVGGNKRMRYVDVEAIRVLNPAPPGLRGAVQEAWDRYRTTLAITEVHNGCTREEQVRWFVRAWRGAVEAKSAGVDIEAVTLWSLLGAYNWNTLLTRSDGKYEPGAFDVAGGVPRPTALARLVPDIVAQRPMPSVFDAPGWWERDTRFAFRPAQWKTQAPDPATPIASIGTPLLIVGATGSLGRALMRACDARGIDHVVTDRAALNLRDDASIADALNTYAPWAVINAAGWVRVDEAEVARDACHEANAVGALRLLRACIETGTPCVQFSSDLVFDGRIDRPYIEGDRTNPLCVYGESKVEMERAALLAGDVSLVIRTSAFFSPFDPHNFAAWVHRELSGGRQITCASDAVVSPTYTPALADAVLDLLLDGERGLWHVANEGALTWHAFARQIGEELKHDIGLIRAGSRETVNGAAPRPAYSALASRRGRLLPTLQESLAAFAHHVRMQPV